MGLYKNIALFLSFEKSFKDNEKVHVKAEILTLPMEFENTNKYKIKILNSKLNKKINNKKFIIYLEKDKKYEPGDMIYLTGNLKKAQEQKNFYAFDYRRYLKTKKIYGIIEIENINYTGKIKDTTYLIGKIQKNIYKIIEKNYDEEYQNFIKKILFGSEIEIEEEIKDDFKKSNLSHVLAISGMHISYIVLFLNVILKLFIKNIRLQNIFISVFLIFFLNITGKSASCERACIMIIILFMSKNVYRKNNIFKSLFLTFCILVLNNMYVIFNIGMWLSFLGTLGILLFYKLFKLFIFFRKDTILYKVQDIINISISAQMLIFPIILYVFNTTSLTFFISNLLISKIIGYIIILGYISIFILFLFFPLGIVLVKLEQILIFILYKIAKTCGKIPLSVIPIKGNNEVFIIIYYICIVACIYFINKNKYKLLKKIIFIKKYFYNIYINKDKIYMFRKIRFDIKIKYKNIAKKILFIILIIYIFNNSFYKKNELEIYFVDVGQGDCTIIKTKNKNIIIDGGEGNSKNKYDYGKNLIYQHLLKLGINKIDYMIFSHFDSDHAGGLIYIAENMKVKEILIGVQTQNSECLESLLKIVKKKNIKLSILESENIVNIDKDCYINVLWPMKNELIEENNLNNNSLVFKFIYKSFSILFTGDIEEVAEDKIVRNYQNTNILKSTILKIAHHGSKTSSTEKFLKLVLPKIALIGVRRK